jgi:hypothetical protein
MMDNIKAAHTEQKRKQALVLMVILNSRLWAQSAPLIEPLALAVAGQSFSLQTL